MMLHWAWSARKERGDPAGVDGCVGPVKCGGFDLPVRPAKSATAALRCRAWDGHSQEATTTGSPPLQHAHHRVRGAEIDPDRPCHNSLLTPRAHPRRTAETLPLTVQYSLRTTTSVKKICRNCRMFSPAAGGPTTVLATAPRNAWVGSTQGRHCGSRPGSHSPPRTAEGEIFSPRCTRFVAECNRSDRRGRWTPAHMGGGGDDDR